LIHTTWNRQIPFPTTRNLQIHVHVYGPRHCCGDWINFRLFCSDDCRSWSREEKSHLNNHGCFVNTPHTFLTMIIEESVCFMSCESIFLAIIYERQISWNFWIKYFHLICHLILTKINSITLKIRSKADFKSKSQHIWQ
jgi:hypothetical protein